MMEGVREKEGFEVANPFEYLCNGKVKRLKACRSVSVASEETFTGTEEEIGQLVFQLLAEKSEFLS